MVQSVDEVCVVVVVICYLLYGICGVGSVLVCVLWWNCVGVYLYCVNDEMVVFVQVEMCVGLEVIDVIVWVDGVDGVFIGLVDFVVDFGYFGYLGYLDVQIVIDGVICVIKVVGKVLGILSVDEVVVWCYLEVGVLFVVVGVDMMLLVWSVEWFVVQFKGSGGVVVKQGDGMY